MPRSQRQEREILRARRHELENFYGPEPYEEGDVIRVFKCFGDPTYDRVFTYLGLRTESGWFIDGQYMVWSEVLLFIDKDNALEHGNLLDYVSETGWREHAYPSTEPPF